MIVKAKKKKKDSHNLSNQLPIHQVMAEDPRPIKKQTGRFEPADGELPVGSLEHPASPLKAAPLHWQSHHGSTKLTEYFIRSPKYFIGIHHWMPFRFLPMN